jgi:flagellar hook-length control protein FliK
LLVSRPGEPAAATANASFDLFLALLAGPLSAGEPLPVTGKDLPLDPAALDPDEIVIPIAPLVPTPITLSAAVELGMRAGTVSSDGAVPPLPVTGAALPPVPTGFAAGVLPELAAVGEPSLQATTGALIAAPEAAESLSAAALSDQPDVGTAPATPSWLDELLAASAQRSAPAKSAGTEQHAAAVQNAASPTPSPAAMPAPAPDAALQFVKTVRDDTSRAPQVAAVAGDTPIAPRADWVPSSASATVPNAPTPPAVAPPSAPVDVKTPHWHEAFAGRVQWLVDNNQGEARIRLNPPELGAIDVKISHVDEKSYVQLTAASPAAREELANGLNRLRELFATSGLTLGGASVESGSAGYGGTRADVATEPRMSERHPSASFAETEAVPRARASGRIDLFA